MSEKINHPAHYVKEGRKECIIEMEEQFGALALYYFCRLNAYKYEYRAGLKGDAEEDLKKAQWYNDYAENLIAPIIENDVHLKTVPVECYNALKEKLREVQDDRRTES